MKRPVPSSGHGEKEVAQAAAAKVATHHAATAEARAGPTAAANDAAAPEGSTGGAT